MSLHVYDFRRGREAWGDIWAAIAPMHDEVAVYVGWGYSPILATDGVTAEGTFRTEITGKVVGERRLAMSRDLGTAHQNSQLRRSLAGMRPMFCKGNPLDIPFAAICLLDEQATSARRAAGTRLNDCSPVFPKNHPVIDGSPTSGPCRHGVEKQ